jgi:hypothetical protein
MSSPFKEPGYFIFNEWAKTFWSKEGIEINSMHELKKNYMLDKFVSQKYFGESSTYDTIHDRAKKFGIANKIFSESPNAKIIYIKRNPFERITSSYYHFNKYVDSNRSIVNYVLEDKSVIETTKYLMQIKPFCNLFKTNVLIFDDFIDDTQNVLNKVYDFLEIPHYKHEEFRILN